MDKIELMPIDREKISKLRQNSLEKIKNDEECLEFIQENELFDKQILDNASKFLRVIEERNKCKDCPGLSKCNKTLKGVRLSLFIDEDKIDLRYRPCKENAEKIRLDNYFIIRDFPDENLKYSLKDTMSIDYREVRAKTVLQLSNIIKENLITGIYLSGDRQVGKTFILSVFSKQWAEKYNSKAIFIDSVSEFSYLNNLNFVNKEEFSKKINELINIPLLVLDDFGNEYKNEFIRDTIIYPILNERLRLRKLTCFTSCYSINEIKSMYALKEYNSPKAKQLASLIITLAKPYELNGLPYCE